MIPELKHPFPRPFRIGYLIGGFFFGFLPFLAFLYLLIASYSARTYGWFWFAFLGCWLFGWATWASFLLLSGIKERKVIREHQARVMKAFSELFGATANSRESRIQDFFDKGTENLSLYDLHITPGGHRWSATLSKNIGTLPPASRESLRVLYLLFNRELIPIGLFVAVSSTLLFDNGTCSVTDADYPDYPPPKEAGDPKKFENPQEMLRQLHLDRGFQNPQAAENFIREHLQILSQAYPGHPTIKLIQARIEGGNVWITASDLQDPRSPLGSAGSSGKEQKDFSYYLGPLADKNQDMIYRGEGSLITLGRPGTGKSQCHAIPNLLRWQGSAIVLDVSGELFDATSRERAKIGHVLRFNPFEDLTARYNPLALLPDDPEKAWSEAQFLAAMLEPPGLSGKGGDHWGKVSREILTAVIGYIVLTNPPRERSFSQALDILSGAEWDLFMEGLTALAEEHGLKAARRTAATFTQEKEDSPKQFTASRSSAYAAVSAWSNPTVETATSASDWTPEDFHLDKPLTVYLTANQAQLNAQGGFFRVILGQHIQRLSHEKFRQPDRPILLLLDEFPALGRMEPIETAMMQGRKFGLRLWLMAQYVEQITQVYGNDGLIKSCAVRSYFNPDFHLAEQLSKEVGERAGGFDNQRQPLVSPQDLTGPAFQDLILTLVAGQKPARLRKAKAYATEPFASMLGGLDPKQATRLRR